MNKKWFLVLTGTVLSAMMFAGCNTDQEPPPEEEPNMEQAPQDNDMNGNNGDINDNNGDINDNDNDGDVTPENDVVPGVDKNDTINKDDENDTQPDPEDAIEDAKDVNDADNKDE